MLGLHEKIAAFVRIETKPGGFLKNAEYKWEPCFVVGVRDDYDDHSFKNYKMYVVELPGKELFEVSSYYVSFSIDLQNKI